MSTLIELNDMYYLKLKDGDTMIEFHNNWLGKETVIVNGLEVSQKSSMWGTHHFFTVIEHGDEVRYVLSSKAGNDLQCYVDLKRNGEIIYEDVPLKIGSKPENSYKKVGLKYLNEYEMMPALLAFQKAIDLDANDPMIYIYMACTYSNMENVEEGFKALKKAVACNLPDHDIIMNHDMLAYLRMRPEFDDFRESGFTQYKIDETQ